MITIMNRWMNEQKKNQHYIVKWIVCKLFSTKKKMTFWYDYHHLRVSLSLSLSLSHTPTTIFFDKFQTKRERKNSIINFVLKMILYLHLSSTIIILKKMKKTWTWENGEKNITWIDRIIIDENRIWSYKMTSKTKKEEEKKLDDHHHDHRYKFILDLAIFYSGK